MKTELSHAERVRRWFAAEVRPEPPTDEELMALAAGRFEVIDAVAVAEAMALDPGSQRRYEEVQRFLERRSARSLRPVESPEVAPAPVLKSLLERASEWVAAQGAVLAATVRRAGSQLSVEAAGSWGAGPMAAAPTLTMRGYAPTGSGQGAAAPVRLKDAAGRQVHIASGLNGYLLEFDLNDHRLAGFLTVQRVALYGSDEAPFETKVLLRGGRGTLSGCPSGLVHVHLESGFEMYLLLEDAAAGTGPRAG
jgi:hypothetical protein